MRLCMLAFELNSWNWHVRFIISCMILQKCRYNYILRVVSHNLQLPKTTFRDLNRQQQYMKRHIHKYHELVINFLKPSNILKLKRVKLRKNSYGFQISTPCQSLFLSFVVIVKYLLISSHMMICYGCFELFDNLTLQFENITAYEQVEKIFCSCCERRFISCRHLNTQTTYIFTLLLCPSSAA